MKSASVILLVCAFVQLCAGQIAYKDCGDGATPVGKVNAVTVSNCTVSPCKLTKGMNYTVGVNFTIAESTDVAFADVHGILDGIPIEFPLPQRDACEGGASGLTCPLKSGATYTYRSTLPIMKEYPSVKLVVEWALNDASRGGNRIWCILTPVEVV